VSVAKAVLDGDDVDALAKQESGVVMAKRVRAPARKEVMDRTMHEPRVRVNVSWRDNKWRAGGAWPEETPSIEISCDVLAGGDYGAGVAVFERGKVEVDPVGCGEDIAIRKVANLLSTCAGVDQRERDYDAAQLRLMFLAEVDRVWKRLKP
jgi:hypothetical protein